MTKFLDLGVSLSFFLFGWLGSELGLGLVLGVKLSLVFSKFAFIVNLLIL